MTSTDVTSPGRNGFRFGMQSLLVMIGAIAVLFAGYGWLHRSFVDPRRQADAVQRHLESLVTRRPNDMSPRQWESAVAWTLNLHGNSLINFQADGPTIRDFEQRLSKKLASDVNMNTILWIWDEYAQMCSGGERYQRFRSQMLDEIESGGGDWGLNVP